MKFSKKFLSFVLAALILFGSVGIGGEEIHQIGDLFTLNASAASATPAVKKEIYCDRTKLPCKNTLKFSWPAYSGASYYVFCFYLYDELNYNKAVYGTSFICTDSEYERLNRGEPNSYYCVVPMSSSGVALSHNITKKESCITCGMIPYHYLWYIVDSSKYDHTLVYCGSSATIITNHPTKNGYMFLGWSKQENASSPDYYPGDTISKVHSSETKINLYPVWKKNTQKTYTIKFDANGGSGAPSSQVKVDGITLTLSSSKPTRTGYSFIGWSTNSSATSAAYQPGGTYTGNANITLYAVWKKNTNIYNLGEETYCFENYGDSDSPNGHCFGMAVTSSGYYTGKLSKSIVGSSDSKSTYSLPNNATVKKPICYYLKIQGPGAEYNSIVAGGSIDLCRITNVSSDWTSCVNYVSGHSYDNKGSLNIGMWYADGGGHAVNFLYYKKVNGQDRIYAYDNNYPKFETYYYMGSNGYIHESSESLSYDLETKIKGLDLMDVNNYFKLAPKFEFKRYIYADKNEILVENAKMYYMKCDGELSSYVIYEIPENETQIKIKPLDDDVYFEYDEEQYHFDKVDEKTCGLLTLSIKTSDGDPISEFKIVEESSIAISNYEKYNNKSVGYNSTIVFGANVENNLDGNEIGWILNGELQDVRGETVYLDRAKSDFTIQAVLLQNGEIIEKSEIESIKVRNSFWAKLVAFFKALFGLLPVLYQ